MPELPALLAFIGTALLLMLVPGPAVIFVITRSIQQGRKAGLVSVLGIGSGDVVNAVITALGLGSLTGLIFPGLFNCQIPGGRLSGLPRHSHYSGTFRTKSS
jgi:threonine/homoserine/homoserine lactone efflux protein